MRVSTPHPTWSCSGPRLAPKASPSGHHRGLNGISLETLRTGAPPLRPAWKPSTFPRGALMQPSCGTPPTLSRGLPEGIPQRLRIPETTHPGMLLAAPRPISKENPFPSPPRRRGREIPTRDGKRHLSFPRQRAAGWCQGAGRARWEACSVSAAGPTEG